MTTPWGYNSYCVAEEVPTTFQIGVVCSDGVLLASDRQVNYSGGYRNSSEVVKIRYKDGDIACCASGDRYADMVAECAVADYSEGCDVEELLGNLGKSTMEIAESQHGLCGNDLNCPHGTVLTVCRVKSEVRLWRTDVQVRGSRLHATKEIQTRSFCGDEANPACFITERYLGRSWERPMDESLLIVAHTLYMAHALNPYGVAELDVLMCRYERAPFEWVQRDRINQLKSTSESLDEINRANLYGKLALP